MDSSEVYEENFACSQERMSRHNDGKTIQTRTGLVANGAMSFKVWEAQDEKYRLRIDSVYPLDVTVRAALDALPKFLEEARKVFPNDESVVISLEVGLSTEDVYDTVCLTFTSFD
ncbi:MAG: hypothetical protein ACYS5V_17750 [Planctomycetota bacterium]|jgi:hypothetical protein